MDSLNSKTSNLIDAYIKGTLSGVALQDFEENFMENTDIAEEIKFRKGITQEFRRQEEMLQFESLLKNVEDEISKEEQTTPKKQNNTQPKPPTKTKQLKYGSTIHRYVSVAAITLLFISSSLLGYGFMQKEKEVSRLSAEMINTEKQHQNFASLTAKNETLEKQKNELEENVTFLKNSIDNTNQISQSLKNKLSFQESNARTLEENIEALQSKIKQLEFSKNDLFLEKKQLVFQLQAYEKNNHNPELIALADNFLDKEIVETYPSIRTTRSLQYKNKDTQQAIKAFNNKNYQQALEYFISSSKNTSDQSVTNTACYIGLCYLTPSVNQVDKAIKNLESVKQQKNTTINLARWYLALAYLKASKLETAKNNLYEIIVDFKELQETEISRKASELLQELNS